MSVHRSAAALGGAVLLAALAIPGSAAAPGAAPVAAPGIAGAAAPAAAVPSLSRPRVTIASTASLVTAGSVFRVDVGYTCTAKSSTSINLEGHQNLGDGFVANGYGFSRVVPTCDGKRHTMRVTVVPMGERGFTAGPAFVIADVSSCTTDGRTCLAVSVERSLSVR